MHYHLKDSQRAGLQGSFGDETRALAALERRVERCRDLGLPTERRGWGYVVARTAYGTRDLYVARCRDEDDSRCWLWRAGDVAVGDLYGVGSA